MADSTGVSSEVSRDLSNLDVTKLTPLSPEVISKQATINIGTIGHVAHGKSTVVKALSGVQTVRFKNELERNITIKLEHQEGEGNEEARVHSTVGPEEDEDLQVLAEIQSTMDSLNKKNWANKEKSEGEKLPDSPSRPSVIQHTEIDSPAKRNINFEAASSSVSRNSNSPDTMEAIPKPIIKRRPGPKSKTRPLEEAEAEKRVSEDSGNISDNSSTSTKKRLSDKALNNSSSTKKHSTKHHDDTDSDDSSTAVKKRPRDDSDSEQKLRVSKKRSSRLVSKDASDSDHSTRASKKRSTRVTSKEDSDSDSSSRLTKKRSTRKERDGSEEHSDASSSRPKRRLTRANVNYDSDNSMDHFEVPKQRTTRSSRLPTRESVTNTKKRKSTSYHDSSSDSDTSTTVSKKQRSSSKVKTEENDKSGSESDKKVKVEKKVDDKKKKKYKVDMTYRTKRTARKRRKEPAVKVTRETPSETRVIEENGPVDMTVGRQSDGDYEVEYVRGSKKIEGRQYYLIKWRGWPEHFNTWEPMEHLVHSQEALLEFFQTESIRSQERLAKLADEIPELTALTGKFAEYERDVVATLTREDFKDMDVTCPEGYNAILPNYRLLCSHISKYLKNNNEELALKIKNLIIQREFVRQRHEQLQALATWEKDINAKIGEKVPLTVENNVDLEGPSDNFNFVLANIPGEGVEIPDEPPVGCDCESCGEDTFCCGKLSESKFAYTKEGLLQVEHGTPVYECNKMCKCDESCPNRVVQKGRTAKLHIFRTPNNIGWGVKVLEDIPQGKFICEYIGEVLKREVADERMKNEYKGRPLYIFDLDFNDAKEFPYTVDAYQHGNVSHFINHSCEPNLAVYAVWIDCLEPNLPRLAMFAIRDIKKGEELTFDYSAQYHRKRKTQGNGKQASRRLGKTPCQCGSTLCRQITF